MDGQSQDGCRHNHKHDPEGVLLLIVCVLDARMEPHQVDDCEGGQEEDHLHDSVVPAGQWTQMHVPVNKAADAEA